MKEANRLPLRLHLHLSNQRMFDAHHSGRFRAHFSHSHIQSVQIKHKQHKKPYIPHLHVHADTLGEGFICGPAAGLPLREKSFNCSGSFPYTSLRCSLRSQQETDIFTTPHKLILSSANSPESFLCTELYSAWTGITVCYHVNSVYRPFCRWIF